MNVKSKNIARDSQRNYLMSLKIMIMMQFDDSLSFPVSFVMQMS